MHEPESVPKNETYTILCDFEMQIDCLIPARRPDFVLIDKKKKRTCHLMDIAILADDRVKIKECEKTDKYMNLPRELKKTVELESNTYSKCTWCVRNGPQRLRKQTGGIGNNKKN